jgi:hypothetical protein
MRVGCRRCASAVFTGRKIMRRNIVVRNCGLALAAILAISAASSATGAAAGGGASHGLISQRGGAVGHSVAGHPGVASRFGGLGALPGAGYAGTLRRFNGGGHESSGWYQHGWGGTLNPGWGYNFEPSLGGSIR